MCYQPLKLPNPSKSWQPAYDRPQVTVPCGHCPECQRQYQSDWYVRSYAEWQRYTQLGGRVLFITLTYNDQHLPVFEDILPDGQYFRFSAFSVSDRQKWLKRVRKSLYAKFRFATSAKELPIKAITYCEYGSDRTYKDSHGNIRRATKRPHYHGLVFIPPLQNPTDIDWYNLAHAVGRSWSDYRPIKDHHRTKECIGHYSYTKDRKTNTLRPFVDGVAGIKYAAKYASKDSGFMSANALPYLIELKAYPEELQRERKSKLSPYLPKHLQGTQFGAHLVEQLRNSSAEHIKELLDKGVRILDNKITLDYRRLPRYILNKLCYTPVTKDGVVYQVLTDFGLDWFRYNYDVNHARLVNEYKLASTIARCQFDYEIGKNELELSSPQAVHDYLHTITPDEYANYILAYRGYLPFYRRNPFKAIVLSDNQAALREYCHRQLPKVSVIKTRHSTAYVSGVCNPIELDPAMHNRKLYISSMQAAYYRPEIERICAYMDAVRRESHHYKYFQQNYKSALQKSLKSFYQPFQNF